MTPVRMLDVAVHAGVSISTVSHVLNGTRVVAPATRDAVLVACAALGMEHPGAERAAERAAVGIPVGLAVTVATNPYLSELVNGVDSEVARTGSALLLADTRDDPAGEVSAVRTLLRHGVAGVLLAPTALWRVRTLPLLRRSRVPFALVDRLAPDVDVDQVGTENETAAAALVGHLLHLGHRRIGVLAGLPGLSTTTERVAGHRRALTDAGLAVDRRLVVGARSTVAGGRAGTRTLLELTRPPTALFAANNATAIGALQALRDAGRRVPDDMALVAFDDFEWADAMEPRLTTAAQPFAALGARAVQLLVDRIADPAAGPRRVRLPNTLEHRSSCGCRPGDPFV